MGEIGSLVSRGDPTPANILRIWEGVKEPKGQRWRGTHNVSTLGRQAVGVDEPP